MGLGALLLAILLIGLQGASAQADPGTLYVDGATGSDTTDCTNPAAPCATIGYALSQAENGDEIRVAEGTYTEILDIGTTVTLRGGYEAAGWTRDIATHPTIVDANGADSSVFHIVNGNITVEGFTVQGANHTSDWGGGFHIVNATVVISGTIIRENSTDGGGGGVFVEQDSSVSLINGTVTANVAKGGGEPSGLAAGSGVDRVTIQDTLFTGNTGDSVLWIDSGVAFSITGGQVASNTVSGGTSILLRGSGTISGTAVLSNTSTGLAIADDGAVSARSLTLRGNTGGIENSGILTITNSIIENNSGGDRAAISSENFAETNHLMMDGCTIRGNNTPGVVRITTGYAEIRNTKIVDNVAVTEGVVGIGEAGTTPTVEMVNVLLADNDTQGRSVVNHVTGSAILMNVTAAGNNINGNNVLFTSTVMTVTNTILWSNTTSADMLGGPGTLSVSYSDIEGGWPGAGNISADPLFVDAANGDYHLQMDSPCINAGTPVGAPTHDIEGTPRDATPDMGAYEWGRFRIFLPLTLKSFTGKQ
jgi:hypothetical protein